MTIRRILFGVIAGAMVAFVVGIAIFFGLSMYQPNGPRSRSGEIWFLLAGVLPAIACGSNVAVRFVSENRNAFGIGFGLVSAATAGLFLLPRVNSSTLIMVVAAGGLLGVLGAWLAGTPKYAL